MDRKDFKELYLKELKGESTEEVNSKMTQADKTKYKKFVRQYQYTILNDLIYNMHEYKKQSENKMEEFELQFNDMKYQLAMDYNEEVSADRGSEAEIALTNLDDLDEKIHISYSKVSNSDKVVRVKKPKIIKIRETKQPEIMKPSQMDYLKQLTFPINKDLLDIDFTNYVLKNQLKEILDQKRIKQKDLANKLGITTPTMSNIINNRYPCTIEIGFRIAETLGLRFTDIFYYAEEK